MKKRVESVSTPSELSIEDLFSYHDDQPRTDSTAFAVPY
jgi:hypothetical protein